tara:strand:+ start:18264 stop:18758 length:495 start_codon:yes stop_codon:yes gene_type:complete
MTRSWIQFMLRPNQSNRSIEIASTILRVAFGCMIFTIHGWHKAIDAYTHFLNGSEWTLAQEIRAMGLPFPGVHAGFATVVQLIAPVLILGGLATRAAAGVLTVLLCGAIAQNLHESRDPQLALIYTIVCVSIAIRGSGRFTLDALIWGDPSRAQSNPVPKISQT